MSIHTIQLDCTYNIASIRTDLYYLLGTLERLHTISKLTNERIERGTCTATVLTCQPQFIHPPDSCSSLLRLGRSEWWTVYLLREYETNLVSRLKFTSC
jgi:hypothetical protein